MFVPSKIRVGFQNRSDTFTKKLAYVIYFDEKGNIRKEKSWKGWCNPDIPYVDYDNTPTTGFVLNKGVQRDGYWGSGRSVIRIHDPREFEFEISVPNLLGVLMHSDCMKREIQDPCVFAWYGTELVLLPTNSVEYQQSIEYTKLQSKKVSAKDLKVGYTYKTKKTDELFVYLGFFPTWIEKNSQNGPYGSNGRSISYMQTGKKHVFHSLSSNRALTPSVSTLAECVSEELHANIASYLDKFHNSQFGGSNKSVIEFVDPMDPKVQQLIENHASFSQYGSARLVVANKITNLGNITRAECCSLQLRKQTFSSYYIEKFNESAAAEGFWKKLGVSCAEFTAEKHTDLFLGDLVFSMQIEQNSNGWSTISEDTLQTTTSYHYFSYYRNQLRQCPADHWYKKLLSERYTFRPHNITEAINYLQAASPNDVDTWARQHVISSIKDYINISDMLQSLSNRGLKVMLITYPNNTHQFFSNH